MALVKNAARNGAVCYHHDSKEIFVLLCLFLPQGPTLYRWSNGGGRTVIRQAQTTNQLIWVSIFVLSTCLVAIVRPSAITELVF